MRSTSAEQGLSTAEFHEAVLSMSPRVAVFDCDGTLWSGDAGSTFMRWTMDTGLVSAEMTRATEARYAEYTRGEVSEIAICGEMVQMYRGIEERRMRLAAKAFFAAEVEGNIFPEMRDLLAALTAGGTEIWTVSSTCDWVIEEGVQRFGIVPERVLAARVEIREGIVTETLLDVPTDEAKVAALRRAGVTAPDAVFGNSVHDAAMLAIARRPFAVNPTPALRTRSLAEGWAVYLPESVREV